MKGQGPSGDVSAGSGIGEPRRPRLVLSYSIGVYLAANAISDARLVVDGPDCSLMRVQYLQGNHDYLADLFSLLGNHRIVHTDLDPQRVMLGREDELVTLLERLSSEPDCNLVLVTALPLADVIGTDYQRLCRTASARAGKPVVAVPGSALQGDWLDGYQRTLAALAENIELEDARPTPRSVALVGLLHDRNEYDCKANVEELSRLLKMVGLDVVSVWLDGGPVSRLAAAGRAATVVSMPYGRDAARIIARRIGARLVEVELPFGLDATRRWLEKIAEACGVEKKAEKAVNRELDVLVRRIEIPVATCLQTSRLGFVGDPFLWDGFRQTAELFGAEVEFAVITNFSHHLATGVASRMSTSDFLVEPRVDELFRFLKKHLTGNNVDCVVTNSSFLDAIPLDCAVCVFGFPSNEHHVLYERPYLGFKGTLAFVERITNAVRLARSRLNGAAARKYLFDGRADDRKVDEKSK